MPLTVETPVDGYVSCIDPRCPGYEQRPVEVIKRVVTFTYGDNGATDGIPLDAPERQAVGVVQTDDTCEHCGKPVIFSDAERPEYPAVSGQDPLELLAINQQTQIRDVQIRNAEQGRDAAELKAMLAEMRAQHAEEMAEVRAELQRRRGGRPPKEEAGE